MRAAVVRVAGEPLTIEDVAASELHENEVRVATRAVGLCHSDLHVLDGHIERPLPHLLGHEAAGIVVEVAPGVDSVSVGDHVVACLVVYCDECRQCRSGHRALCSNKQACNRVAGEPARYVDAQGTPITQFSNIGALVEEMIVHHSALTPIPAEMPFDAAALLGCSVVTGVGSIDRVAKVQPGESVAVVGCGGIGLNLINAASNAGATTIVAIDLDTARRDSAVERFGATHAVDGSDPEAVVSAVVELTAGGADHVFDAVGANAITQMCLRMTTPGATTYAVGIYPSGSDLVIPADHVLRGKKLVGVRMGDIDPPTDIPALAKRYLSGDLPLDHLITGHLSLEETNAGFDQMRSVDGTRTVVVFPE